MDKFYVYMYIYIYIYIYISIVVLHVTKYFDIGFFFINPYLNKILLLKNMENMKK